MTKTFRILRALLIAASLAGVFVCLAVLALYPLRETVIILAERFITHRPIVHEAWHRFLIYAAVGGILLSVYVFIISFVSPLLRMIILSISELLAAIGTMKFPPLVKAAAFFLLFLLLYVRYNINLMLLILACALWRAGFVKWLSKTFGDKETKTALAIAGIAAVFFVIVMLLFRVAIVMDFFGGSDQNRVWGDFTQVDANHYRVKVHPFYVLVWQSLYHLLCPLKTNSSLAIRAMVAIFAGLNVGLFSLIVSRILKNGILNILLCVMVTFSFPQIYHGAQMLESFIFTQTSILLAVLYFSFALLQKKYNLPVLLALALFVTGNNIAYICLFGIFYLFLLFSIAATPKEAAAKIFVFGNLFAVIFSILLLVQSLFYGMSAPSNILSLFAGIVSEEGAYIMKQHVNWIEYAADFFNTALFEYLPGGIGHIINWGWFWAALLVVPFLLVRKIENRRFFFAVAVSCAFLFVFHRFYGSLELALYAPAISGMYLCLFAFVLKVLPWKLSTGIGGIIAALLIGINSLGAYNMYRVNDFVFGKIDIGDWLEYQQNIDAVKDAAAGYEGNKLLFFKTLDSKIKNTGKNNE